MVLKNRILSSVVLAAFALNIAVAQSKNEAITLYNQGIGLMKTDPAASITTFDECLKMCDQVGDSAANIKEKVNNVLPEAYFQVANKLLTTDKKVPEAIAAAKVAITVAAKYESAKTKDKIDKVMVQAYVTMGSNAFGTKDFEFAIKAFDSALTINPNYGKAMFNKALAYKKMDNAVKFGETIDLYIAKVKADGDTTQVAAANKQAVDYYRVAGSKANQANKLAEAENLLTSAQKYGTDKDVFYYLADVYNKQKKFADALVNAQKGLDMETGTPEAKAKFYYALAVAQAGKGEKDNACASFKNSLYGPFLEPSKAQMTNLKCPK